MKLVLLRHAKSDWSTGTGDHDRPLNARGRADAPRIAASLRERGHTPTLVLCSTAARTRETLARMRLQGAEVSYLPTLYLAEGTTILDLANANPAACLLIIAHNPGIAAAASAAVTEPPARPEFARYPTASCTVVDMTGGLPGDLLDFTVPADLQKSLR